MHTGLSSSSRRMRQTLFDHFQVPSTLSTKQIPIISMLLLETKAVKEPADCFVRVNRVQLTTDRNTNDIWFVDNRCLGTRGEENSCNLRGNVSGRRSKLIRAPASYEENDEEWQKSRELSVFRGDVAGEPPCEMPQQKFQCGDCKNRLPDLTNDMCRLLSYKSLNGLVRDRDKRRKNEEDGKSLKTLEDKVRVVKIAKEKGAGWKLIRRNRLEYLKRCFSVRNNTV